MHEDVESSLMQRLNPNLVVFTKLLMRYQPIKSEHLPEVGSSRNKREGLDTISLAILARFRSPPETPLRSGPPMMVFLALVSPSPSMYSSTLLNFWPKVRSLGSLSNAVILMVCFTVKF